MVHINFFLLNEKRTKVFYNCINKNSVVPTSVYKEMKSCLHTDLIKKNMNTRFVCLKSLLIPHNNGCIILQRIPKKSKLKPMVVVYLVALKQKLYCMYFLCVKKYYFCGEILACTYTQQPLIESVLMLFLVIIGVTPLNENNIEVINFNI